MDKSRHQTTTTSNGSNDHVEEDGSQRCNLKDEPWQALALVSEESHGLFVVAVNDDTNDLLNKNNQGTRYLRHNKMPSRMRSFSLFRGMTFIMNDEPVPPLMTLPAQRSVSHQETRYLLNSETPQKDNDITIMYGRKCFCALSQEQDLYCPRGTSICQVSDNSNNILCHENKQQQHAMHLLMPFLALLYLLLGCLWIGSSRGKYARQYVRKVTGRWTEAQYQDALRHEMDQILAQRARQRERLLATRHYRNPNRVYYSNAGSSGYLDVFWRVSTMSRHNHPYHRGGRRSLDASLRGGAVVRQNGDTVATTTATSNVNTTTTAVGLKTRHYNPNQDKYQEYCMICLAELLPSDRIGDLPCGHAYHVEPCLKEWIVRKNQCPLCQGSALALPLDSHGTTKIRTNTDLTTMTTTTSNEASSDETENNNTTTAITPPLNNQQDNSQDNV